MKNKVWKVLKRMFQQSGKVAENEGKLVERTSTNWTKRVN